jgi:hypothetical protein
MIAGGTYAPVCRYDIHSMKYEIADTRKIPGNPHFTKGV